MPWRVAMAKHVNQHEFEGEVSPAQSLSYPADNTA